MTIRTLIGGLVCAAALTSASAAFSQAATQADCPTPQGAPPAAMVAMPGQAPGAPRPPRQDPYAGKKKVLFIGDTLTGNQVAHDSVYSAMAEMQRVAADNNIAVFIRTDWNNVTLDEVYGTVDYARCGSKQSRGRNLEFFDAIVFYINGETRLTDDQKADLMEWIRSGKGFVGIHTATAAGVYWPEYGQMIGGYFDNHPWNTVEARVIVEQPDFPGMQAFVAEPVVRDEFYQMTGEPYSRENTDVLMRVDTASVDMTNRNVHRTDGDFPVAWARNYGQGRVFYSALGHPDSAWRDPRVTGMYLEAIKWATGLTEYQPNPHPLPQ